MFRHLMAAVMLAASAAAQAQPEDKAIGRIWESTGAPAEHAAAAPTVSRLADGQWPAAVFDRNLLVDLRGHTLYVFDGDRRPGFSTCYGVCETLWPAHLAPAGAAPQDDFTLVPRRDGSVQWGYRGRPLYRWARDRKPGDVTGDNVNEVWHVIREGEPLPIPGKKAETTR